MNTTPLVTLPLTGPNDSVRTTILPPLDGPDGEQTPLSADPRPRFAVVGSLGQGGIGEVFAADDRDIGRRVAIKRLRPDRRSDTTVARFVQEVRTVGQLDHPNIVPLHDIGREDDGGFYLVMKYIDGETVESLIERLKSGDRLAHQHWTFERRVALFIQVLHAVQFAHDRGIVHRDLKPANVMVGRHGEVHVVDWGLAKRLGAPDASATTLAGDVGPVGASTETRAGALIGTPRYMAPEQARGEPADVRTDTWALSLLFYELLTLSHYLDGTDDLHQVLDGVLHRPIPSPVRMWRHRTQPPVPAELGWFLVRGLERDPNRRFQSVAEMLERLEHRMDGEIEVSCAVTAQKWTLIQLLKLTDRHPVLTLLGWGALAVAVVVAFLGAIGFGAAAAGLVALTV
ncbi:MAG: serine/threonine-protein kinase [Myxococcota bacterium]